MTLRDYLTRILSKFYSITRFCADFNRRIRSIPRYPWHDFCFRRWGTLDDQGDLHHSNSNCLKNRNKKMFWGTTDKKIICFYLLSSIFSICSVVQQFGRSLHFFLTGCCIPHGRSGNVWFAAKLWSGKSSLWFQLVVEFSSVLQHPKQCWRQSCCNHKRNLNIITCLSFANNNKNFF